MKNIRLYTFAVLFAHLPTPEKIVVYMKSRDKLATSDVKLSSRIAVESTSQNPEVPGSNPRLGSPRSSLISIEHAELLSSTPLFVLCCAWLVTMALHVHGGLGQLGPLPTSGDDE